MSAVLYSVETENNLNNGSVRSENNQLDRSVSQSKSVSFNLEESKTEEPCPEQQQAIKQVESEKPCEDLNENDKKVLAEELDSIVDVLRKKIDGSSCPVMYYIEEITEEEFRRIVGEVGIPAQQVQKTNEVQFEAVKCQNRTETPEVKVQSQPSQNNNCVNIPLYAFENEYIPYQS